MGAGKPTKRSEFESKFKELMADGDDRQMEYRSLQRNIIKAAEGTCRVTSGRRGRESWLWCRKVQGAIKEKRRQYKIWQRSRSEED